MATDTPLGGAVGRIVQAKLRENLLTHLTVVLNPSQRGTQGANIPAQGRLPLQPLQVRADRLQATIGQIRRHLGHATGNGIGYGTQKLPQDVLG